MLLIPRKERNIMNLLHEGISLLEDCYTMRVQNWKKQVFTIPNILSLFRLILIPVYIHIYLNAQSLADYHLPGYTPPCSLESHRSVRCQGAVPVRCRLYHRAARTDLKGRSNLRQDLYHHSVYQLDPFGASAGHSS